MYVDSCLSDAPAGRFPAVVALQRTRGDVSLLVERRRGASVVARCYRDGAMQVRTHPCENSRAPPQSVLINTAGGLTGGDATSVRCDVRDGASALLTGQACEKIYRARDAEPAHLQQAYELADGASLQALPQPTIVFDGARLVRHTRVDMASSASLLAVESCVLGRTSMGETMTAGSVSDTWRVHRDGRTVFADGLRFDAPSASVRSAPAAMADHCASATCLYVAPDAEQRLDEMRSALPSLDGQCAASGWQGMACARFVARDGTALTAALVAFLEAFRAGPLPRVWYC